MPIASTVHAWTVNKLCTCSARQKASRSQLQLYSVSLQHASQSRQGPAKRASPVPRVVATTATERPVQQQRPVQPLASSQRHQGAANNTTETSQQQEPNDLTSSKSNTPVDLLDPQNYTGTSDKQRRKQLVKYLSTIPESEMTPEMLRRWRISKANRGKKAWNHGRRHPPETIAKITQRTQEAMLRPEVLQRVRANHPHANRIATPEMKANISRAITASHQKRGSRKAKLAALAKEQQVTQANEEPMQSCDEQSAGVTASIPSNASEATAAHSQETASAAQATPMGLHQAPDDAQNLDGKANAQHSLRLDSSSSSCSSNSGHEALDVAEASSSFQPLASPSTCADDAATEAVRADDGNSEAEASTSTAASSPPTGAAEHADAAESKGLQAQSKQRSKEHKHKISLALQKKWAEPGYRDRVLGGMRSEVTQTNRVSAYKATVMRKTAEGRGKLQEARAKQEQLNEARQTVRALQLAVQAGQQQAEALRGDQEGFARQQEVLDTAQRLVEHAQAQVAAMEANTPSLEQVAAELGARPSTEEPALWEDEQADAGDDAGGEYQGSESDDASIPALQAIAADQWSASAEGINSDVYDVTAASQTVRNHTQRSTEQGVGSSSTAETAQEADMLQPV